MMPANGSGEPSIFPPSPSQRHKGHFARDGALHPISGSAPDQWQYTRSEEVQCLRIGCSAPINKNKRGIRRSIDATITSKLHEGRRRVELNQEMSRRADPLLCGERRATADPGCGARGRRQGLAGLRDRSLRAEGSSVAISRAGRRPRTPETNQAAARTEHATASSLSGGQPRRRRTRATPARITSTAPPPMAHHRIGDGVDAVSLDTAVTLPLASVYSMRAPVASKW